MTKLSFHLIWRCKDYVYNMGSQWRVVKDGLIRSGDKYTAKNQTKQITLLEFVQLEE